MFSQLASILMPVTDGNTTDQIAALIVFCWRVLLMVMLFGRLARWSQEKHQEVCSKAAREVQYVSDAAPSAHSSPPSGSHALFSAPTRKHKRLDLSVPDDCPSTSLLNLHGSWWKASEDEEYESLPFLSCGQVAQSWRAKKIDRSRSPTSSAWRGDDHINEAIMQSLSQRDLQKTLHADAKCRRHEEGTIKRQTSRSSGDGSTTDEQTGSEGENSDSDSQWIPVTPWEPATATRGQYEKPLQQAVLMSTNSSVLSTCPAVKQMSASKTPVSSSGCALRTKLQAAGSQFLQKSAPVRQAALAPR